MTKRLVSILTAALMLLLCGCAAKARAAQALVTVQGYDFTVDPPCTADRPTDCLEKFTFADDSGAPIGEITASPTAAGAVQATLIVRKPPAMLYGPQPVHVKACRIGKDGSRACSPDVVSTIDFEPASAKAVQQ